jgi:hypothetical protein
MDAVEILTAALYHRPEGIKDPQGFPALLGAMDTGIIAEMIGQLVPLATGSRSEDNAVERFSGIDAGSAGGLGRIEAL